MASAEGEEDVDILQHNCAYVLLAEAAAILRAGGSVSHRAQAAEKIIIACSGPVTVECSEVSAKFLRDINSRPSAADAADVGAAGVTFARYLDTISYLRVAPACGENSRRQCADHIMALLEAIRARPEAVDESLRRLGTTLTAARLEFFSLVGLVDKTLLEDPVLSQRAAFARRQAFLSSRCAACPRAG
jgi:hypothetical protein